MEVNIARIKEWPPVTRLLLDVTSLSPEDCCFNLKNVGWNFQLVYPWSRVMIVMTEWYLLYSWLVKYRKQDSYGDNMVKFWHGTIPYILPLKTWLTIVCQATTHNFEKKILTKTFPNYSSKPDICHLIIVFCLLSMLVKQIWESTVSVLHLSHWIDTVFDK